MTIAVFLAHKYEDDVRDIVVYEMNRHLLVPVVVEDINLSLLQKFPYASLRFSNVMVPMTSRRLDTLIFIDDLYLQIGLLDFFRKQYNITEADADGGFVRMELYEDGTDNYHFWKSKADSSAGAANLRLRNIELANMAFSLEGNEETLMALFIEKAETEGDFGADVHTILADADIRRIHYSKGSDVMFDDGSLAGEISVHVSTSGYELVSDNIRIGKESFEVKGTYSETSPPKWTLDLSTENAQIEHIIEVAPLSLKAALGAYRAKGKTDLRLHLQSEVDQSVSLDAYFNRCSGSFQHEVALGKANISDATGSLHMKKQITSLNIEKLKASIGPGNLQLSGKVINFDAPTFDLNLMGSVDLNELRDLLNIEQLEILKGILNLNGSLSGKLHGNSNSETIALLKGLNFDGSITLQQGSFKLRDQSQFFDHINGNISISSNNLLVQNATARVNQNTFEFSGSIENALPYLVAPGQKLHIEANFSAESIDLNEVLSVGTSARDTSYRFELPKDVTFALGISFEEVRFRKFIALNARGNAYYSQGLLTLNPVEFRTAGGVVRSSIALQLQGKKTYQTTATATLYNLSLRDIFEQFEDFGQQVIRSSHLSGTADAHISVAYNMGTDLQIDNRTLKAQAELIVTDGKLKNLEALQGIPDYLRKNALWNSLVKVDEFERKLKVIEFDTLKNTIQIENNVIEIPHMTIRSSAMTMNISGTHDFDNRINYALNFRLGELLRSGKKTNEEFGYIVDDNTGLRLFMLMTGTVDNPSFSLDKDASREKRKLEFEKEKNTMKSILRDEFGFFKNDSTLTSVPGTPERRPSKITVDWGVSDPIDSAKTAPPKTAPKKPKPTKKDDDLYDELEKDDDL